MKTLLTVIAVIAAVSPALGQERMPTEETEQEFPRLLPEVLVGVPLEAESGVVSKSSMDVAVALGPRNIVHIAWIEAWELTGGVTTRRVFYSGSDPATRRFNGFSAPTTLSTSTDVGNKIAVAVNQDGNVFAAWQDLWDIKYAKRVSGTWSFGTLRTGYQTAADELIWSQPRLVAYPSWQFRPLPPGPLAGTDPVLLAPRIDFACRRNYVDFNTPANGSIRIEYQSDMFGSPGPSETVYDNPAPVGGIDPLAIKRLLAFPDGAPVILWRGTDQQAWISRRATAGTWAHTKANANPSLINEFDGHVSRAGTLHMAYAFDDPTLPVHYRALSGGTLGPEEVVPNASGTPRILGDSRDLPHLFAHTHYFRRLVGAWVSRDNIITDGWTSGLWNSDLAMGPDDSVHLAGISGGAMGGETATYSRILEPNLGIQDAFVMLSAGLAKVNAATGSLYFSLPVFSTAGRGLATSISLVYNSGDPSWHWIERGWRHNYDVYLTDHEVRPTSATTNVQRRISVVFGDGRTVVFQYDASELVWTGEDEYGHFSYITRAYTLGNIQEPTYTLTTRTGMKYFFDKNGRLEKIRDPHAMNAQVNEMTFTYTGGKLTKITDSVGRETIFTYTGNRLTKIKDRQLHEYLLIYDADGVLAQVDYNVSAPAVVWNFGYQGAGRLLNLVTNARGFSHTYLYTTDHRILSTVDPAGGTIGFEWLDDTHSVAVTNRRGYTSTILRKYRYGMAQQVVDENGNSLTREITSFRGITSITDRRGKTTTVQYWTYTGLTGQPGSWVKNNAWKITRPGQPTPTEIEYNSWSRPTSIKIPKMNSMVTTTVAYGDATSVNPTSVTYPAPTWTGAGSAPSASMTWEDFGRIATETDENANLTDYDYGGITGGSDSGTGLVTSILRPGRTNRETRFYDVMGRLWKTVSPQGAVTEHTFDLLGRITQTKFPDTDTAVTPIVTYTRDANGNVTTVTGPRTGQATTNVYDELDRLVQSVNALGHTTSWEYDADGYLLTLTRPDLSTVVYTRDGLGRILSETHDAFPSPPFARSYEYDPNGNTLVETHPPLADGTPVVLVHEYDARNNRTKTTSPDGAVEIPEYYDDDRLKSRKRHGAGGGPPVAGAEYEYTERGQVWKIKDLLGNATVHKYDAAGNLTEVKDPLNHTRKTDYDAANRPIKTYAPGNLQLTESQYDDDDRVILEKAQDADTNSGLIVNYRAYEYTASGAVKKIKTDWNGGGWNDLRVFEYDAAGNLTRLTDEDGHVVEHIYDLLDRRTHQKVFVTASTIRWTEYQYDSVGNLTGVVDPRGNLWGYAYDRAGRRILSTYPAGGATEQWTYTAQGWVADYRNRNGVQIDYQHDPMGRVILETPSDQTAPTVRGYDGAGRLILAVFGAVRVDMNYDVRGLLQWVVWSLNGLPWRQVSYVYNADGLRTQMTDPEGLAHVYAYNSKDQLQSITRNGVTYAALTYDNGGRRKTLTYGNGSVTTHNYDAQARTDDFHTQTSGGATRARFQYVYDDDSQRTSVTLSHLNRKIDYDVANGAHELRSEFHTDTISGTGLYFALFSHDDAGNRILKDVPGLRAVYTPAADNRIGSETRLNPLPADPSSVSASDTESGYSTATAVDDVTDDGTSSSVAWASTNTVGAHSFTFNLASSQSIGAVTLYFPSTRRPLAFRVEVGTNEIGTELPIYAAVNAQLVSPGVFKANARQVTFYIPPVSASAVTFTQNSGGGASAEPNRAYLNEFLVGTMRASTVVTYGHDLAGNRTAQHDGRDVRNWTYDAYHRVTSYFGPHPEPAFLVDWPPGSEPEPNPTTYALTAYVYDGLGNRVCKAGPIPSPSPGISGLTPAPQDSWFVYDGSDVVADYRHLANAVAQLEAVYVSALSLDGRIARISSPGAATYYLTDALGTNHRMLDSSQAVVRDELTNAYGEVLSLSGALASDRHSFAGRERDSENGLMHFRHRTYDPAMGRFIQLDPIVGNRPSEHYLYARNNPVNLLDPLGLEVWAGGRIDASGASSMPNQDALDTYTYYYQFIDRPDLTAEQRGQYTRWTHAARDRMYEISAEGSRSTFLAGLAGFAEGLAEADPTLALDIIGFIPGIGELADLVTAGVEALRGDEVAAILSGLAAIPFMDAVAKPLKWAYKAGKGLTTKAIAALRKVAGELGGAIKRKADDLIDGLESAARKGGGSPPSGASRPMAGVCFVAGTKIPTEEGTQNIEEIRPGDRVLSKSDETGEVACKEVLATFVTRPDRLYHVRYLPGEAGAAEEPLTLVTTAEHPFWAAGRGGWVPAKELRPGDVLWTTSGRATVVGVEVEQAPQGERFTTYNFEVSGFHTYFAAPVESQVGAPAVWVHNRGDNACAAPPSSGTSKTVGHHSDPKFMGGDPKQPRTHIPEETHKALHKDMNDFLAQKTDDVGKHMRPQRGNSGRDIRRNFSREERLEALAEFYAGPGAKYGDGATDFFKQHPDLVPR